MLSLRLAGETDEAFMARAERCAAHARIVVEACLSNRLVQQLLAEGRWTEAFVRRSPTVRVEYEQAIAIGGIGETIEATKSKHWGDGPYICPLQPDDVFYPERITYLFRENSLYNRRFEQRMRLKELLGREHRTLVGEAKWHTKSDFLRLLTERQSHAIRRVLRIDAGLFWRACQGKTFLLLPPRLRQLTLPFGDAD